MEGYKPRYIKLQNQYIALAGECVKLMSENSELKQAIAKQSEELDALSDRYEKLTAASVKALDKACSKKEKPAAAEQKKD